jgi:hypothetical protein
VADAQTTIVSALGTGGAGLVATNPGTATSTVVSAGSTSGAGCVSGSVFFNPPLSAVLYPERAIPSPTDGVTGVVLPPVQGFAKVGETRLRALGEPHFAFALPAATLSYGGGPYYNAYVFFMLENYPAANGGDDGVHWLLSFHETAGQNRELISIGVTTTGNLVAATRDSGVLMSPNYSVPVDGRFHLAQLELDSVTGIRKLYLDGRCLVSAVGAINSEQAAPEYLVPVRVALFNGSDGLSRLNASISRAGIGLASFVAPDVPVPDDLSVNWPIDEGSGGSLYVEPGAPADLGAFGPVTLEATWWDGAPASVCPEEPTAPLTSAYTWAFKSAWTARPPYSPEYRKVVQS